MAHRRIKTKGGAAEIRKRGQAAGGIFGKKKPQVPKAFTPVEGKADTYSFKYPTGETRMFGKEAKSGRIITSSSIKADQKKGPGPKSIAKPATPIAKPKVAKVAISKKTGPAASPIAVKPVRPAESAGATTKLPSGAGIPLAIATGAAAIATGKILSGKRQIRIEARSAGAKAEAIERLKPATPSSRTRGVPTRSATAATAGLRPTTPPTPRPKIQTGAVDTPPKAKKPASPGKTGVPDFVKEVRRDAKGNVEWVLKQPDARSPARAAESPTKAGIDPAVAKTTVTPSQLKKLEAARAENIKLKDQERKPSKKKAEAKPPKTKPPVETARPKVVGPYPNLLGKKAPAKTTAAEAAMLADESPEAIRKQRLQLEKEATRPAPKPTHDILAGKDPDQGKPGKGGATGVPKSSTEKKTVITPSVAEKPKEPKKPGKTTYRPPTSDVPLAVRVKPGETKAPPGEAPAKAPPKEQPRQRQDINQVRASAIKKMTAEKKAEVLGKMDTKTRDAITKAMDELDKPQPKPVGQGRSPVTPVSGEAVYKSKAAEAERKARKAQVEEHIEKKGKTVIKGQGDEAKVYEERPGKKTQQVAVDPSKAKRFFKGDVTKVGRIARRSAKSLIGGIAGGLLGAGLVAERAAAAPSGQRTRAARGEAKTQSAFAAGAVVAAKAAPSIGRLLGKVAAPAALAYGAYDVGRLVKEGFGAFTAARHAKKTKKHAQKYYGTVEAATKTRRARAATEKQKGLMSGYANINKQLRELN